MWKRGLSTAAASLAAQHRRYGELVKPTMSIGEFRTRFRDLPSGWRRVGLAEESPQQEMIVLCGRVVGKPRISKNVAFFDIKSEGSQVQVLAESQYYYHKDAAVFQEDHTTLQEADAVAVSGYPGKSKKGELSIIPVRTVLLSPCLHQIPSGRGDGKYALSDKHLRYRHRHLDLLSHGEAAMRPFVVRAKIIRYLRNILDSKGFLEVETPILGLSAGGAIAKPFMTKSRVLGDCDLSMRIAPELYLKRLVVGGIDRVYEIGKVFRNEGISAVHNPEFTSCEFYQAYADYEDLMKFTEELLRGMATEVLGSTRLSNEVDLEPPFRRISIIPALEEVFGLQPGTFPNVNDVVSVQSVGNQLMELVSASRKRAGIVQQEQQQPNSVAEHTVASNCKLLDELIGIHLETQCTQPTFLCDHPIAMSPLAKEHAKIPGRSQRFELFMNRKEVVNAYSELNDPKEQLVRFENQFRSQHGTAMNTEVEVMPVDNEYCKALEYGLPPTAGWGMGIDRIAMMFSGASSIRDVILFPMVGPTE